MPSKMSGVRTSFPAPYNKTCHAYIVSAPRRVTLQHTPHACHRQHTLGSFLLLAHSEMVSQRILIPSFLVRSQVGLPNYLPIVQRIEHRASTSRMWVRFLLGGPANGVVSVTVNTTDCDSVNTGSIPVRLPKQHTPHACHRQHTLGSFLC